MITKSDTDTEIERWGQLMRVRHSFKSELKKRKQKEKKPKAKWCHSPERFFD